MRVLKQSEKEIYKNEKNRVDFGGSNEGKQKVKEQVQNSSADPKVDGNLPHGIYVRLLTLLTIQFISIFCSLAFLTLITSRVVIADSLRRITLRLRRLTHTTDHI